MSKIRGGTGLKRVGDPNRKVGLDWTCKGIDVQMEGCGVETLSGLGRSLFDDQLLLPVAVLKSSVIHRNSAWMRNFLKQTDIMIAPHGKTTMAPDLFQIQLADGAWGLTASTVHHVRAYRHFGVDRVLMANQLVGRGAIRWVLSEMAAHREFDFYCFADSLENVRALMEAARQMRCGRPIQIFVEIGGTNGRAGVRTLAQGVDVASAVAGAFPYLELVGVATYEGIFQALPDGEERARRMLDSAVALAKACDQRKLFRDRIILTAGGSGFFDLASRAMRSGGFSRTPQVVIRAGCYLTQDYGLYADLYARLLTRSRDLLSIGECLQPALQVWGQVVSRPEPHRVICGVGKRDIGCDLNFPMVVSWARANDRAGRDPPPGCVVVSLNDQHAYVDGPTDMPFAVGDFIALGPSHPCTTFDKWRVLLLVDESYFVVGAVRTYF